MRLEQQNIRLEQQNMRLEQQNIQLEQQNMRLELHSMREELQCLRRMTETILARIDLLETMLEHVMNGSTVSRSSLHHRSPEVLVADFFETREQTERREL